MKKEINASPLAHRLLRELGENIRFARLRRKLSIQTVANRAGIAINTVVAIEKGATGVSIGAIINTLHCLGLAADISLIAKDDVLGRKLQDLQLALKKRAPKIKKTNMI